MENERVVTKCGDCPASSEESPSRPWAWCALEERRLPGYALTEHEVEPPRWCPLRQGPITIRLAQKVVL